MQGSDLEFHAVRRHARESRFVTMDLLPAYTGGIRAATHDISAWAAALTVRPHRSQRVFVPPLRFANGLAPKVVSVVGSVNEPDRPTSVLPSWWLVGE